LATGGCSASLTVLRATGKAGSPSAVLFTDDSRSFPGWQPSRPLRVDTDPVDPVAPELGDAFGVEGGGAGAQLAPGVLAEVLQPHLAQVDLAEPHRRAGLGRLGPVVDLVDEHAHGLRPRPVR